MFMQNNYIENCCNKRRKYNTLLKYIPSIEEKLDNVHSSGTKLN